MSAALDAILADVEAPLEVVVELDSLKRSDGTAATWYYSTHTRQTGAAETPANTSMPPYLMGGSVGPLVQSLAEDSLFSGMASQSPGSVTVVQKLPDSTIDQLSQLNNYTFAGRQVRIKIGRQADAYASFVTLRTATCEKEPTVRLTGNGIEASWPLNTVLGRLLNEPLIVKRHVGIPTCLRILTSTGAVSATKISAYDVDRFSVMVRFRRPSAANPTASFPRLFGKVLSDTNNHFRMRITQTTGLLNATSSSGGVADINISSAASVCDGAFHTAWFSRDAALTAYLLLDETVVNTATPAGAVDQTNTTLTWGANAEPSGNILDLCEARFYDRYIPPDEARSLASVRAEAGDLGLIGLWRFDDNAGSTVNDYSSNNNDGTAAGVLNTDHSWQPTDLGEPELAGSPMPLFVGEIFNARAHLIDGNRERYRLADGAILPYIANPSYTVRSRGTVLTGGGTDYTAPSGTTVDTVVDMVAQEDEPVTFDVASTLPAETYVPEVIDNLLTGGRTRLVAADMASRNVGISQLCHWRAGYFTDADQTAQQALAELVAGSGMSYYEDPSGDLFLDFLLPPVGYGPYGEPCYDFFGHPGAKIEFGDVGDASSNLTVVCWVNFANVFATASQVPAFFIARKGDNYQLLFTGDTTTPYPTFMRFTSLSNPTVDSPSGLFLPSTWYMVAAVFNDTANTLSFYVGQRGGTLALVKTATGHTGAPTTDSSSLTVGTVGATFGAWAAVQHLQVWTAAKSLGDLQALMATPPVGNEANLAAYVPFNEGEGTPVEKVSSTTGTVTNGPPQWAPKLLINLNETPSVRLKELRHVAPASEIEVRYARNRHPMTSADIDSGVSQNNRLDLMREWKSAILKSADNLSRYKNARKLVLDSPLSDRTGAQRLARALMTRFGTDTYLATLELPTGLGISRRACGLGLSDEVGLRGSIPSQLASSRSFRVAAVAPKPLALSTEITVLG